MHITERHWYWTPWSLTRWGFRWPLIERGDDEWHNPSWIFTVPLLGAFVWFPAPGYNGRWGEEHVWSASPEGYEGRVVKGCEGCEEFVQSYEEWTGGRHLASGLGSSDREPAPVQEGQDPLPEGA
jgi:hypothetical protein